MCKDIVKGTAMWLLRRTRYPKPVVKAINLAPVDTSLEFDKTASIERGCKFIGDISLGPDVLVGGGSHLEGDVNIGRGTYLVCQDELIGNVSVGNFCAIARDVTVQARDHLSTRPSIQMRFYDEYLDSSLPHTTKGPTNIGSDVWIGTGAIILSGVDVGHGSIIGAGSVVTSDVEPYSITAGVTAERKGWRFSEDVRDQLIDIKWWEWDEGRIRRNREFFETEFNHFKDLKDLVSE